MAYSNVETMVNESLVRAAVIVYFQQNGENNRKNLKRIREEQRLGFFWMDQLVDLLKQYKAKQTQYPTFSSYVPQVASFYRAHVVSIAPFANHAQDVDPSLQTMTITVDKPLDPSAGFSINTGTDGKAHYPIEGEPKFGADGLHLLLLVHLQPNQTYSFVLTPRAFATPDGYPLKSYKVEFRTK